jgi:hypothetical protein
MLLDPSPQDLSPDDMVSICCWQGSIHFMLRVRKREADKCGEIARRYPTGYWDKRGIDLLKLANQELGEKGEKEKNRNESPRNGREEKTLQMGRLRMDGAS